MFEDKSYRKSVCEWGREDGYVYDIYRGREGKREKLMEVGKVISFC